MPEYAIGDAVALNGTQPTIVAHIVNDIGKWGSGFVIAVSRKWPRAELKYRQWATGKLSVPLKLGLVQMVAVEPNVWVANMCAQRSVRKASDMKAPAPIDYAALEATLLKVAEYALRHGATVQMPRIGSGRAGGSWERIEQIIDKTLGARGVSVIVYDMTEHAALEFLSQTHKPSYSSETTPSRRA